MSEPSPIRLAPSWREKIWGSKDLSPLFPPASRKMGEAWYDREDLPILVKFLFTSDTLSVQVHPDDEYARIHEGCSGKTEMWYVLRANPGASIALGLTEELTPYQLREAALSGEIVRYLNWVPVKPGDAILSPAGTLHSIGPGLALCEIQQHSDITYRFYDYGRLGEDGCVRPLHIDKAVETTHVEFRPSRARPEPFPAGDLIGETLVGCEHFIVERLRVASPLRYEPDLRRFAILVALEGSGTLGGQPYQPGEVYLLPAGIASFDWTPAVSTVALRTYVP